VSEGRALNPREVISNRDGWTLEVTDWQAVGDRLVLYDRRSDPAVTYPLAPGFRPTRAELTMTISKVAPDAPADDIATDVDAGKYLSGE
jgi:hypothetical protein